MFSKFKKKPFLAINCHKIKLTDILCFFFLFGLIYGVIISALNYDGIHEQCDIFFKNFIEKRLAQGFTLTCISSFLNYTIFIVIFFLIGLIPISQFVCIISPLFYGLGLGLISAYLLLFKGFFGTTAFFLTIFPWASLFIVVLMLACRESFKFSNKSFTKLFIKRKKINYSLEFRFYFIKFLTLLFFQVIVSIIDGLFMILFIKLQV